MNARDEFSARTKETLAKRVAQRCSNPACLRATSGPHADEARAVNVGVASHITAAAGGGPRYDTLLSTEARTAISNGIWLCQTCAKLIDGDAVTYDSDTLRDWKRRAEFHADMEILGNRVDLYLPQPATAVHAPLPRIAWRTYHEARVLLIDAGWQPRMRHWTDEHCVDVQGGNGPAFWRLGYWEIINAWSTGWAQCTFSFHDTYQNHLTVLTKGEEIPEEGASARVSNWFFDKPESA